MRRRLIAFLLVGACAVPRPSSPTRASATAAPVAALAPLGEAAAACSTLAVASERRAEGITRVVQLATEGSTVRRVRGAFDSAGRPVVLTAVAQTFRPGAATALVEYVELRFDSAGVVRGGQHTWGTDDGPVGASHGARPLAPADSVDGPALARAVRDWCAR